MEDWLVQLALAVGIVAPLVHVILAKLQLSLVNRIGGRVVDCLSTPEARRDMGQGFAAGMRASANGTLGKDGQTTAYQERTLMATALKDWMGENTPLVRLLMDKFPETWKLVQKQPELGFLIMSKWGPRLEAQAQAAMDRAAGAAGLNEQ